MDGLGGYYAQWNTSERERWILYDFTSMWNLKQDTNNKREEWGGAARRGPEALLTPEPHWGLHLFYFTSACPVHWGCQVDVFFQCTTSLCLFKPSFGRQRGVERVRLNLGLIYLDVSLYSTTCPVPLEKTLSPRASVSSSWNGDAVIHLGTMGTLLSDFAFLSFKTRGSEGECGRPLGTGRCLTRHAL